MNWEVSDGYEQIKRNIAATMKGVKNTFKTICINYTTSFINNKLGASLVGETVLVNRLIKITHRQGSGI